MGDAASVNKSISEAPFPLTEVDKWVLSQTDEEFQKHGWEELKTIIATNNLSVLKRKPSDLRRYIKWTTEIKAEYGSMTQYILAKRLPSSWGWPPFSVASSIAFADPTDYHVLLNDWPYGLEPNITHLVVWSRTGIPVDNVNGDLTPESRALVDSFVKRYFVDVLGQGGEDRVMWFKNWVSLQSVRTLEHVHVLVRDVDDDILERWTGERPKRDQ
ncbi:N-acetylglucosamine-induced protein 1 [Paramyrothecium foliicola]|nr:N-acetylglucosamine-induced protein 1 [Paramyrothecium foliicola]